MVSERIISFSLPLPGREREGVRAEGGVRKRAAPCDWAALFLPGMCLSFRRYPNLSNHIGFLLYKQEDNNQE
jgi:hypothetical protein